MPTSLFEKIKNSIPCEIPVINNLVSSDNDKNKDKDDKNVQLIIKSGSEHLRNPFYQNHLHELKHLVSVTPATYQLLYMTVLQHVAAWMQALPSPIEPDYQRSYGLFSLGLARAVTVLKHRRAYMLPPGANAEMCYKQQEAWTYALFTAGLLQDCWQIEAYFEITLFDNKGHPIGSWDTPNKALIGTHYTYAIKNITNSDSQTISKQLTISERFIPPLGLQWLQRFAPLFNDWCDYLNGNANAHNTLAAILQKAELALLNKPVTSPSDNFLAYMLYPTTRLTEVKKIDSIETTPNSISVTSKQNNTTVEAPKIADESNSLFMHFIAWLKQALADETFIINQIDAFDQGYVHLVEAGIFLVIPDLWERFCKTYPDLTQDWQALTTNNDYFIRNNRESFLHVYCVGDAKNRQTIRGLLLKPAILYQEDPLPAINPLLSPDPLG